MSCIIFLKRPSSPPGVAARSAPANGTSSSGTALPRPVNARGSPIHPIESCVSHEMEIVSFPPSAVTRMIAVYLSNTTYMTSVYASLASTQ